jgi:hypothetical protein
MCWFKCYSKELYLVNFWLMFMVANFGLICTSKVLTRRVRWTPTLMVPYTVPTTFYEAYLHQVSGPKVPQFSTVVVSLNLWTWSSIVESDISSLINVLSRFLCLINNLPQVFALSCALWKSSAIFPNIHWDSGWIGDLHLDGLDTVLSVLGKVLWKGRRSSDVTSRRLTLMQTEQVSCHIWRLSFADGPHYSLFLSLMREMLENMSRACWLSCLVHR